jgi:hypothetical protein
MTDLTDLTDATLSPGQVERDRENARLVAGAAERVIARYVAAHPEAVDLFDMVLGGEW